MLLKLAVMRNGQIGSLHRRGQRLMAGLEFTANAPLPLWPHVSSLHRSDTRSWNCKEQARK